MNNAIVWKRLNINQEHYSYVYIARNISISIGFKNPSTKQIFHIDARYETMEISQHFS